MTDKEIVQALRCTSTPGDHTSNCEQCPYWKKEQLNGRLKEKLGTDTWTSCDIDKVGLDAADLIERLTAENAALREKVPLTEDTMINLAAQALGVEPSRLRELAEADKDGHVVVLPCKVGDTVYMIERIFDIDNGICDEICARKVIGHGGNNLNQLWLVGSGGICNAYIFVSEFGKTVFLTREEAERAIQEMEGKG